MYVNSKIPKRFENAPALHLSFCKPATQYNKIIEISLLEIKDCNGKKTYGFSIMTLQMSAIVLRQSVVFSTGKSLFC